MGPFKYYVTLKGGGGGSKNVTGQFLLVILIGKVDKTCHMGGVGAAPGSPASIKKGRNSSDQIIESSPGQVYQPSVQEATCSR
jgi:hypothetical protein